MSHHYLADADCEGTCKVFVKATRCAGSSDPGYDVYVHERDLPPSGETWYFQHFGACYSISDGTRECRPKGSHRVVPKDEFDDCTDCENNKDGGPGNGGGGGGGEDEEDKPEGPGFGSSNPCDDPDNFDSYAQFEQECGDLITEPIEFSDPCDDPNTPADWIQLTPCPGQTGTRSDLYVPANISQTVIVQVEGRCYTASPGDPTTPCDQLPADAVRLIPPNTNQFADCSACTSAYEATVCPGQDAGAPRVWVRTLPSTLHVARVSVGDGRSWCYSIDQNASTSTIDRTQGIVLNRLAAQWSSCSDCKGGRKATPCPVQLGGADPADAPDVYVRDSFGPGAGVTWYFARNGWCYSVSGDDPIEDIPDDGVEHRAWDQFADCETCVCGAANADPPKGAKVRKCDGDFGKDYWVHEDDLPPADETWTWLHNGRCVSISGGVTTQIMPRDAIVIPAVGFYDDCSDCRNSNDDDDDIVDPPPTVQPPPFRLPRWPIPWARLRDCANDELTDPVIWVNTWLLPIGSVFQADAIHFNRTAGALIPDECYYVDNATSTGPEPPGRSLAIFNQILTSCAVCGQKYILTNCDDAQDQIITNDTKADLTAIPEQSLVEFVDAQGVSNGKIIVAQNKCWTVDAVSSGTTVDVTATGSEASCNDCPICTCGNCTFDMTQNLIYTDTGLKECRWSDSSCTDLLVKEAVARLNSGNPITLTPTATCGVWEVGASVLQESADGFSGSDPCTVNSWAEDETWSDMQVRYKCSGSGSNRWQRRFKDPSTGNWLAWEDIGPSSGSLCDGFDDSVDLGPCADLSGGGGFEFGTQQRTHTLEFEV